MNKSILYGLNQYFLEDWLLHARFLSRARLRQTFFVWILPGSTPGYIKIFNNYKRAVVVFLWYIVPHENTGVSRVPYAWNCVILRSILSSFSFNRKTISKSTQVRFLPYYSILSASCSELLSVIYKHESFMTNIEICEERHEVTNRCPKNRYS